MTIFEFGDCASASVASIPRQRRYEFGNSLTYNPLKRGNSVRLYLLTRQLLGFTLNPILELLDFVELLRLPIDRRNDRWRQFDAQDQRVDDLDRVLKEVVIVLGVRLLHCFRLNQTVEVACQALLCFLPDLFLDLFARSVDLLRRVLRNHFTRAASDFGVHNRIEIIRSDELVQHANVIVQQLVAHIDLRVDDNAVLADGVVSLRSGLQPQVIEK